MKGEELRILVIRKKDTLKALAENLGVTEGTLQQKIKGKQDFWRHEILIIKKRYGLSMDEVDSIFFDDCVSREDTNDTLKESEA